MKSFCLKIVFFISSFYLIISFEALYFELNYLKSEESIFSKLYSKIKIGTPESSIYSYISSKKPLFSMLEVLYNFDKSELSSYYNLSLSNSFKNISCLDIKFVTSDKDIHDQEKFIFNLYNNRTKKFNEIIINDMDFVLGVRQLKKLGDIYFMNIGFPIIKSGTIRDKFYFIPQLKEKNIIDNYDWFIYYENQEKANKNENEIINLDDISNIKANLIIGGQPHYYKNDIFYKSQLLTTYTDVYGWILEFKDVYLYLNENKISTYENVVQFYFDELIIYAPPYYTNLIKNQYFNKYTACHERRGEDTIYYCDKSNNFTLNDLKKFPSLYFKHIEYDYIFELSYQDLFIENNDKYYFLVTNNNDENWLIGYPLLKKYQFVFNQDSKTIGFYNPDLPKEKEIDDKGEEEDDNSDETESDSDTNNDDIHNNTDNDPNDKKDNNGSMNAKTIAFIIVISGIVFIVIGIIIGKIIFKKMDKKRRANELDDNYDYNTYENENGENIN